MHIIAMSAGEWFLLKKYVVYFS